MIVENPETVEVCGMYGGEEGCIQDFRREGDHLEDLRFRWEDDIEMILKLVGDSCKGEVEGFCESGYELCVS
jgi:hypothetical protein